MRVWLKNLVNSLELIVSRKIEGNTLQAWQCAFVWRNVIGDVIWIQSTLKIHEAFIARLT